MVVVTDGSKGSWDADTDPAELAAARRREQQAAAAALGARSVVHLDYVDGELEYSMALRAELCRHIRLARPEVLLSHDPWQRYQLHPDHRATGFGAVDGMVAARDPLFFPDQGLDAHRPAAMLLWSTDAPDHAESIETTVEHKITALLCHSSQGTTTMGGAEQDDERRDAFSERIRTWAAEAGATVDLTSAERFKRLTP
jgi:LmbE family N-acetylglucosaminyl deacetylase